MIGSQVPHRPAATVDGTAAEKDGECLFSLEYQASHKRVNPDFSQHLH